MSGGLIRFERNCYMDLRRRGSQSSQINHRSFAAMEAWRLRMLLIAAAIILPTEIEEPAAGAN
jgi:hypothetical protein